SAGIAHGRTSFGRNARIAARWWGACRTRKGFGGIARAVGPRRRLPRRAISPRAGAVPPSVRAWPRDRRDARRCGHTVPCKTADAARLLAALLGAAPAREEPKRRSARRQLAMRTERR